MSLSKLLSLTLVACLFCGLLVSFTPFFNISTLPTEQLDSLYKDLSEDQKRMAKYGLAGLNVHPGLEATLFASEPTITNPTNIDIDHLGRVWVCEAYNYRPEINGNPTHAAGDRILILEDTDGDGKSDKTTVFYQGPEINSPIGIWVMGNKVIVSQSPYVWQFTDEDGDGKADKKEVIFQGIGGEQHDHGMHAFVFGPDGKLYFNFGNEGISLLDGNGKPVKGKDGQEIDFKKFKQGMVFRCDPDFTNLEVLGHNFRNNYEVAVDSYGTMWQSDNDDDGNKGVRINYVMPYGNYGYTDEMTGAGWRANRTNMEDSVPLRHWHLNDPGVVPNLLQTGSGSPTGMLVYEGRLLPKAFWDQMIHCEPGHNVVRAYPIANDGAGYKASILNLVDGKRDQWFRPSDVCVATDGSIFISDWYDPGVGGHQAGDQQKGRIYRVAPKGIRYKSPVVELKTVAGAIEALQSPNLSVRYMAWEALIKMKENAIPSLEKLYKTATNERMKARALWMLVQIASKPSLYIDQAVKSSNPNIRIAGLRAAREYQSDVFIQYLQKLQKDPNVQVRRECALLLHGNKAAEAAEVWSTLAMQYQGRDRWYLEALGIGAEGQWDTFYQAWKGKMGANILATEAARDIIWRSRSKESIPLLAELASEPSVTLKNRLRYFRAFDFNEGKEEKSVALLKMLKGGAKDQKEINNLVFKHLDPAFVKQSPEAMGVLQKQLDDTYNTPSYMEMVSRYEPINENARLLSLALEQSKQSIGRQAAQQLLKQGGEKMLWKVIESKNNTEVEKALESIRSVGSKQSIGILTAVGLDNRFSDQIRGVAFKSLGGTMNGEDEVLSLLRKKAIPTNLTHVAADGIKGAWRKAVKVEAAKYLAGTEEKSQRHPNLKTLIGTSGNTNNGKKVFEAYCALCHQVNGAGLDFGPKLSEIGSKLTKEAMYASIFEPSAGIGFGYEGFAVKLKDGTEVAGIIASKSETDLILKLPGGTTQEYKMTAVKSITQLKDSMMPVGLQDAMSTTELVDLIEYMSSLKK